MAVRKMTVRWNLVEKNKKKPSLSSLTDLKEKIPQFCCETSVLLETLPQQKNINNIDALVILSVFELMEILTSLVFQVK